MRKFLLFMSGSFQKLLLSFTIIFLLPFFALSFISDQFFIKTINSTAMQTYYNEINLFCADFEKQYIQLSKIHDSIIVNPDIGYHYEPQDLVSVNTLRNYLHSYQIYLNSIADIGLYCENDEYIITAQTTYNLDHFFRIFDAYTAQETEQLLQSGEMINMILPATNIQDQEPFVLLFFPVVYSVQNPQRTTIFIIKSSEFSTLLQRSLGENDGAIMLIDEQGNALFALTSDPEKKADIYLKKCLLLLPDTFSNKTIEATVRIDNALHDVIIKPSFLTRTYAVGLFNHNTMLSNTVRIHTLWLICLAILLIVGLTLIIFLANKFYLPIRKLSQTVSSESQGLLNENSDIELIENYISKMKKNSTRINEILYQHQETINEYITFKLLKGEIESFQELINLQENHHLQASELQGCAIVVRAAYKANLQMDVIGFSKTHDTTCILFTRDMEAQSYIIIYLCYPRSIPHLKDELIQELYSAILNEVPLRIGIGSSCANPGDFPRSFLEALSALEMKDTQEIIVPYSPQMLSNSYHRLVKNTQQAIDYCSNAKSTLGFIQQLSEIAAQTVKHKITLAEARLWSYKVFEIVKGYSRRVNLLILDSPDILHLIDCQSLSDVDKLMRETVKKLMYSIEISKKRGKELLVDEIINYLNVHYNDINLSQQLLADHFGLPLSILAKYFKDTTGKTLLEYLTDIRINKACSMLKSTQMNISDIGMEVGFINVTSFIRRFKQITRYTPGDYRKAYAEKKY